MGMQLRLPSRASILVLKVVIYQIVLNCILCTIKAVIFWLVCKCTVITFHVIYISALGSRHLQLGIIIM